MVRPVDVVRLACLSIAIATSACDATGEGGGAGGGAGGDDGGGGGPTAPASGATAGSSSSSGGAGAAGGSSTSADAETSTGAGASAPGADPTPCDDPEPILLAGQDTGVDRCAGGHTRRRAAVECPLVVPRDGELADCLGVQVDHPEEVDCTSDAACGEGSYCAYDAFCTGSCGCRPIACRTDADCDADEVCLCGDPAPRCVRADCRTDADCADGFLCLGAAVTYCDIGFTYTTSPRFACQRPEDTCLVDTDCPHGATCNGGPGEPRTCAELEECDGSNCGP